MLYHRYRREPAGYVQNRFVITDRLPSSWPAHRILRAGASRPRPRMMRRPTTRNKRILPGIGRATYQLLPKPTVWRRIMRLLSRFRTVGRPRWPEPIRSFDGERSNNYEFGVRGGNRTGEYDVTRLHGLSTIRSVNPATATPCSHSPNTGKTCTLRLEGSRAWNWGGGFKAWTPN